MAVYAVFEPPMRDKPATEQADRFVFVRDGFTWGAFLLGPVWMLWRRLWLAFVVYAVVMVALGFGLRYLGAPPAARALVAAAIAILLGIEGATLRRAKLMRRGCRDHGIVVADDLQAAETRFFEHHDLASGPVLQPHGYAAAPYRAAATEPHVIGLFPEPGAAR
jgi:hypothetical protein